MRISGANKVFFTQFAILEESFFGTYFGMKPLQGDKLYVFFCENQKYIYLKFHYFCTMLKVTNLSFGYIKNKTVLEDLTFFVKAGEHLCIMGESGCGKSTLLKLLYGLLDTDKGKLFWNEEEVTGPKLNLVPGFESFKYVAQDFDLMPYISVSENIKKFLSRFYPAEAKKRTLELLEIIEMEDFADAKVKNLSGGQQQRVAIARALAKEPKLLLLD
jgi:iron(III) transport system ATP-binding protein